MEDRHRRKAIEEQNFSNWKKQLNQFMTLIFIGNYHILNRGGDSIIIKQRRGGEKVSAFGVGYSIKSFRQNYSIPLKYFILFTHLAGFCQLFSHRSISISYR